MANFSNFPFTIPGFLKRWYGNESNAGNPEQSAAGDYYRKDHSAKFRMVLGNELGYRPFYSSGIIVTRAKDTPVVSPGGYNGAAPMELFPKPQRPEPWRNPWRKS